VTSTVPLSPQEDPAAREQFFRDLERRRTKALVERKRADIEELHAPDYELITPAGNVFSRTQITEWSFSPAHQSGGNQQPGVWMTGNALRLMERLRPGVLYVDLSACNSYAGGLAAARGVHCPALVILGERDRMAPARGAKELISTLTDSKVVTLADTGHSLMIEDPNAVLDALRKFL